MMPGARLSMQAAMILAAPSAMRGERGGWTRALTESEKVEARTRRLRKEANRQKRKEAKQSKRKNRRA
jgi:hypothetical protein